MLLSCWARDGLIDAEICERMGLSMSYLQKLKTNYPEVREALDKSKEVCDYQVENALLKLALGYETKEVKTIISGSPDKQGNRPVRMETVTKQIAPNVTACLAWLNNRRPDKWRKSRDNEQQQTDNERNINIKITRASSKKDNREKTEDDEEDWDIEVSAESKESGKSEYHQSEEDWEE